MTDAVLDRDGAVTFAVVRTPEDRPASPAVEEEEFPQVVIVGSSAPVDVLVSCVIVTGTCSTVAEVDADVVFATGWS